MTSNPTSLTPDISADKTPPVATPSEGKKMCHGRSFCRVDHLTLLLGAALAVTGVALFILQATLGYNFLIAGISSVSLGGGSLLFGLMTHCCLEGECLKESGPKRENASATQPASKKADEVKAISEPAPPETTTKAYFESKGIFGVPQQLLEELDIWRMYRRGEDLGGLTFQAGLLLYGPPGNGKTSIGKAIAELLGGEYREHIAGDLINPYMGQTETNMSKVFEVPEGEFRVILIDEIDGLLTTRDTKLVVAPQFVSHFLGLVSGETETKPRRFIIGTTNTPKMMDPAAYRSGRLQPFLITYPDQEARFQIFQYHLNKAKLSEGEDWSQIARELAAITEPKQQSVFSCATLLGMVGAACRKARLDGNRPLKRTDFFSQ
ncbi:ATP-binding protein [Chlamydiota bacterium]